MNSRLSALRLPTLAEQALAAALTPPPPPANAGHYTATRNSQPAGVVRQGSAAEAVVLVLADAAPSWRTYAQIREAIPKHTHSDSAIKWALLYLRGLRVIESADAGDRDSRHLKYRIVIPQQTGGS